MVQLRLLLCCLVAASPFCSAPCHAQGAPGGQSGGNGSAGKGSASALIPPGVSFILGLDTDNSLIVQDPPTKGLKRTVAVKAEWLEMVRAGSSNTIRRFRTVASPVFYATDELPLDFKLKTPARVIGYKLTVGVELDGAITLTLQTADAEPRTICKLDRKDGIKIGESVVVHGVIEPQGRAAQQESYLQLTFCDDERPLAELKAAARQSAPAK